MVGDLAFLFVQLGDVPSSIYEIYKMKWNKIKWTFLYGALQYVILTLYDDALCILFGVCCHADCPVRGQSWSGNIVLLGMYLRV